MKRLTNDLENEIFQKVRKLKSIEKSEVLEYLEHLPKERHTTRLYRRKAMREIREALDKQRD